LHAKPKPPAIARKDLLAHGIAVFYRDKATGLAIMEQP
jgi:hypothetical protein